MIVYRIDTNYGESYTLTEKELYEQFTKEQLEAFKSDSETYFYKTTFTESQLKKARRLKANDDYCYDFEEEHSYSPGVYDILKAMNK